MTYVKTHLLTFKTQVENLKHDVWIWSRDSQPIAVCGKRGSKSFY